MSSDREILTALLYEVSRQSEPFQSLIHDYSAEVMMDDPEAHRPLKERLDADLPMRREIEILKASPTVSVAGPLSPAMRDVLAAADALPVGSHQSLREIADLVAVELVYKLQRNNSYPLNPPESVMKRDTAAKPFGVFIPDQKRTKPFQVDAIRSTSGRRTVITGCACAGSSNPRLTAQCFRMLWLDCRPLGESPHFED
jgi:hypothetical protein